MPPRSTHVLGAGVACVLLALTTLAWSGGGAQPALLLSENLESSEQSAMELQRYSFLDSSAYSKSSASIDAQSAEAFGIKRKAYKKPPPGAFPIDDEQDVWARHGVTGHIYGVPHEYRHMRVPNDDAPAVSSSGDAARAPSSSAKGRDGASSATKWAARMLAEDGNLHGPSHDYLTADESETASDTGQEQPTRHRLRDAGLGSESTPLGQLLRKYAGVASSGNSAQRTLRTQKAHSPRVSHRRARQQQQRKQASLWHDSRGAHPTSPVFARAIPIAPVRQRAFWPAAAVKEPAVEESPISVTVDRPPVIWATAESAPAKADAAAAWSKLPRAVRIYERDAMDARNGVSGVLSGAAVQTGTVLASGEASEVAKLR
ncbi:hypothetical protein T484DRAFT_1768927 [Baffinella frigidus]|nr:hypothetical protein T484DRAFT_1768927 [Cryptophyta sp. CCMP2293]